MLTVTRLIQTISLGLLLGFLYFQLSFSYANSLTKVAFLFGMIANQGYATAMAQCTIIVNEKKIIKREHDIGITNVFAYFFAKTTADLPFNILFPFLYCCITYWMVHVKDGFVAFLIVTLTLILITNVLVSVSYWTSAMAPSTDSAPVLFIIVVTPLMLFSGFFVNLDTIANFWVFLMYLSPLFFGMTCILNTVFRNEVVTVENGETLNGEDFIEEVYGIKMRNKNYAWGFIGLALLLILYRLLSVISLYIVMRKK